MLIETEIIKDQFANDSTVSKRNLNLRTDDIKTSKTNILCNFNACVYLVCPSPVGFSQTAKDKDP